MIGLDRCSDPGASEHRQGESSSPLAMVSCGTSAGVPIAEVRRLHGMGPKALALLTEALEQQGLSFGS